LLLGCGCRCSVIECDALPCRKIELPDNGLTGPVSNALFVFTSLVTLNLQKNWLSGSVPSAIGTLTSLTSVDLSENKLTGSIPTTLMRLSGLQ
jgi:Leucine-rich repeat (LRR) protein